MKKIALITNKPSGTSGVSVFMGHMQKVLQEAGYDAKLVSPVDSALQSVPQLGYTLSYALLRDQLKKFDLVMGNSVGLSGAVDLDVKTIYNAHSNSIGGNLALRRSYEQLQASERYYLNKVLNRASDTSWRILPMALTQNIPVFSVDKIAAQHSNSIIAVSPGVARNVIENFEVPSKKVQVIFNGIDNSWIKEREIDPLISDQKVNVVFTGRADSSPLLIFLKGIDRMIGAMSGLKGVQPVAILFIANKEKHPIFHQLLDDAKIKHVFNVENNQLKKYLRYGDIYIHTSRTEACSLSLLEAMASGMAVVTYSVGAVPDVVESGHNGIVVSSIEEMRQSILELANNPALRLKLAENAQKTVKKYFSFDRMVNKYLKAIAKVI